MVMLALVCVVGVIVGIVFYKGNALDADSRAYVDRAVPAITASWDKDALLARITPELRQSLKSGQVTALFAQFSRLGPLVKYEGAKGQANMACRIGSGGTVSAAYVAKADYQNGAAAIRVLLVKHGGDWFIQGFHVDPEPTRRRPGGGA
ncbi:MAG: hypothetical protein ACRETM_01905 [Stenotrophobium sp.]